MADKPPKELVDAIVDSLESGEGWDFETPFKGYATHRGSKVVICFDTLEWTSISVADRHYFTVGFLLPPRWQRRICRAANAARDRSGYAAKKQAPILKAICELRGLKIVDAA